MPSGLHGENGISPHATRKIIVAYILPRLLYGLEALIINKTDIANLDRAYKRLLKSLTALREGTADEVVFILLGLLPAEAELHLRILSLFGSITRLNESHSLCRLALRQAANTRGYRTRAFSGKSLRTRGRCPGHCPWPAPRCWS